MSRITIVRASQTFGPYTEQQATALIENNKLLLNDSVLLDADPKPMTLRQALKRCHCPIPHGKSAWETCKNVASEFLLPYKDIMKLDWKKEWRYVLLGLIGLIPLGIVMFCDIKSAYSITAMYFSALWGCFFYAVFKTAQTKIRLCIMVFFATGLIMLLLRLLFAIGIFSLFKPWCDSSSFPIRFFGFFICAGLPEELCKGAILLWLVLRRGEIYLPQTLLLYGLFSGLSFGINEGIDYQMTVNREHGVDLAYFYNILRLTSLPFLHALWCGITAYFISFSALFPSYRRGLWIVAFMVPAILHAFYNSASKFGIVVGILSVILFTVYMTKINNMKQLLK